MGERERAVRGAKPRTARRTEMARNQAMIREIPYATAAVQAAKQA